MVVVQDDTLRNARNWLEKTGKVFAVDIHEMALNYVDNKCKNYDLKNVDSFLVINDKTKIKPDSVDVIYALDMFHHISDAKPFLTELYRIIKKNGKFYLEDGHQSREKSLNKISQSNLWQLSEENQAFMVLTPRK